MRMNPTLNAVYVYVENGASNGEAPTSRACAQKAVDSCRAAMPNCKILQISDKGTPRLSGVGYIEMPFDVPIMLYKTRALAAVEERIRGSNATVLALDTDTYVFRDVGDVVRWMDAAEAHVAMYKRRKGEVLAPLEGGVECSQDIADHMPYNAGVIFINGKSVLFNSTYAYLNAHPEHCTWYGDQRLHNEMIKQNPTEFPVLNLPQKYNFTPVSGEFPLDLCIMHFKGKRKDMMLSDFPEKVMEQVQKCMRTSLNS
jgi:hypothetical protein